MRLIEELRKELLVEGIKEVQAKYPNIEESKFYQLIKLDPTYKDGVDSVGTYGKWILNLYNKNKLKEEDFYKVTDYLTDFESKKKWIKQKDIGQYKTLPDLAKALEEVSVELSQNQKDRAFKKKFKNADLDADLVYEDEKWEVWIPKTYESSCKLATDTQWCTGPSSHGNDYYYNMYTSKGPLYINLNKNDEDEKYQFHFPTKQFMDRHDSPIQLSDLLNKEGNDGIRSFYISLLKPEIDKIKKDIEGEDLQGVNKQRTLNKAFDNFMDILGDFALDPEFKEDLDFFLNNTEIEVESDEFEGDREMSGEFIQNCFSQDIFDYFDYSYDDIDALNKYTISDISDETEKYLERFKFPYNVYTLILTGALPEEYSEYESDLIGCLQRATIDGASYGSERAALMDFEYAIEHSAPKGVEYIDYNSDGARYKISKEWLKKNLDEIDYQLGYYSDAYSECIREVLKDQVNEYFNFQEPYYGWNDFNKDAFNDRLQDELYDNFKFREDEE